MDRYARNENALSPKENRALRKKSVCVVGCGGLGGFVIELLARAGVGRITAVDNDTFEITNLNRQLYCTPNNLGQKKAVAAKERIATVNPEIQVEAKVLYLDKDNAQKILQGHDLVLDCLDSIPARFMLEKACQTAKIPMIHGAIAGWYGQVAVSVPGSPVIEKIYPPNAKTGAETELGNPPFTPCCIAAWQVAEAIKVLTENPHSLISRILYIDLLHNETNTFTLT